MTHLIIGAVGLLLMLAGLFALMLWAAGEDAGVMLGIVLGSVVFSVIIAYFVFQLAIGLEEVFSLSENE